MIRLCQCLAASRVGISRRSAARMISLRTCPRFTRNRGLSLSHSGTEKLADLGLHWPGRLELPSDELSFYRFALNRIFEARFSIHKRGCSTLKSRVTLPIFLKR